MGVPPRIRPRFHLRLRLHLLAFQEMHGLTTEESTRDLPFIRLRRIA